MKDRKARCNTTNPLTRPATAGERAVAGEPFSIGAGHGFGETFGRSMYLPCPLLHGMHNTFLLSQHDHEPSRPLELLKTSFSGRPPGSTAVSTFVFPFVVSSSAVYSFFCDWVTTLACSLATSFPPS